MKEVRPSCESYEILISTWMDEGLEHDGQRQLFDHVVRCPECRSFYADARALEGLVPLVGDVATDEEPSPELWERIQSEAIAAESESEGWSGWAWRAAAALLLGAALAFAPWPTTTPAASSSRQMNVVLEEDRGDMTESRFLELTTEILRADRRYHFAMQEVIDRVIDEEWEPEGVTSEGLSEDNASDEDEEAGAPFRV